MAIGCGLARIACRHSHTTLMQSTHKFSPKTQKKTDNSKVIRFWRCVGDSNGEAIEPIPYKKAQGVSPSNKPFSYRLNPTFVSSAVRNVMLGALDKAALPKARLRWLGACGLARIRHQPPEP